MYKQVEQVKEQLPKQHQDVAQFAGHVVDAIDLYEENHIKEVASDALAGIKANGEVEKAIKQTMQDIKKIVLDTLKKTKEDVDHIGDKSHQKNFKDGIK